MKWNTIFWDKDTKRFFFIGEYIAKDCFENPSGYSYTKNTLYGDFDHNWEKPKKPCNHEIKK